ncbi:MAG: nitric oxide reductase activation protein NorD [Desulfococcaceae bacterium]
MKHSSSYDNCFEKLRIVDPDLTGKILAALEKKPKTFSRADLDAAEEDILWAFVQDIELGEIAANGYSELIGDASSERVAAYRDVLHISCEKGLNLGRMMALYWVPVLKYGHQDCLDRFPELVRVMLAKGEYILKKPLDYLSVLLERENHAAVTAFMGLLHDVFSQELPYKESLHLARAVPDSVSRFSPEKQSWQVSQIRRIARADVSLTAPFLTALEKGLVLLSEEGLKTFVTLGLEKSERSESAGRKFLSLESKPGMDAYKALLITVSLPRISAQLNRYLRARTDSGLSVRSMSSVPKIFFPEEQKMPLVCSDGKHIYLPDYICECETVAENTGFCKCLAKLESAFYEFGTFDFDLERAIRHWDAELKLPADLPKNLSDMEMFFHLFPIPCLAEDLFNIFEQGRVRILLKHFYPGISRRSFPLLCKEMEHIEETFPAEKPLRFLYKCIAMGESPEESNCSSDSESEKYLWVFNRETHERNEKRQDIKTDHCDLLRGIIQYFEDTVNKDAKAEICAGLVWRFYPELAEMMEFLIKEPLNQENYTALKIPYKRKLRPDMVYAAFRDVGHKARQIKVRLEENGLKTYISDIQKKLLEKQGSLSSEDIEELVLSRQKEEFPENLSQTVISSDLLLPDLSEILGTAGTGLQESESSPYPVFRYKEWDSNTADYLPDHVRVAERFMTEIPADFYSRTLHAHYALVRSIRRAFEMLKPEDITILRQWTEGDEFDYRALLDFAIDRKAGLMPSDRLYIKRIKQQRNVAVLLLTDLSRSTANRVFGSQSTVMDMEKEAIVLFCEALGVVGDDFAIAGFSGTGRLSVDYFRIKDFDESVNDNVKNRINGMSPQRSTRMGAAIRHATRQLEQVSAKVRILIILSDGFPNDTDYKREYAIADTRRAVSEARAKNIHARAITVNIVGDEQLDELYGSFHHNVISDVRELPDKLLRIYSSLTR